jgi:uncharacterized protein (DUF2267 family)
MTTPAVRREGLIARVIGWLRAGYPDGVPEHDYVALLGILRRTLTPTEVDQVVEDLSAAAESGETLLSRAVVERHIEDVLKGSASADDVVRVSARLAAAGWPLGTPVESDDDSAEPARDGLIARVVGWLRAGYPSGLPPRDFVAVVALLRRRLSDEEVRQVAEGLVRDGMVTFDKVDVGVAIAEITAELPSEGDVERVREYLNEHGWPADFQI